MMLEVRVEAYDALPHHLCLHRAGNNRTEPSCKCQLLCCIIAFAGAGKSGRDPSRSPNGISAAAYSTAPDGRQFHFCGRFWCDCRHHNHKRVTVSNSSNGTSMNHTYASGDQCRCCGAEADDVIATLATHYTHVDPFTSVSIFSADKECGPHRNVCCWLLQWYWHVKQQAGSALRGTVCSQYAGLPSAVAAECMFSQIWQDGDVEQLPRGIRV
jgi:hypothetical protein